VISCDCTRPVLQGPPLGDVVQGTGLVVGFLTVTVLTGAAVLLFGRHLVAEQRRLDIRTRRYPRHRVY
jgi:hypothetical protein